MLASVAASATVNVTPLSVDYTNKKVTFKVEWSGTPAPYNNRVWVWIDFCPINGTTPANSFSTATISTAVKTAGNGTVTYSSTNTRGFFMEYASATNSGTTVTATLINASGKFNWCAYGSNYPPNATMANGTYTLKGSSPFKITYNGSSYTETTNKIFTLGCIASITDATGCPGIINYPAFSAGTLGNGSWGSRGEFLNVGGTPLTIVSATAASGGSGKITYKWFKNNTEISGATAATYLPPKADASAAGTFNYTRKAYDDVCHTAGTTASGTWQNVVSPIIHTYTGCSIYVARYDLTEELNWTNAASACSALGNGWRLPTGTESSSCFCLNRLVLGLRTDRIWVAYWTSNMAGVYDPNYLCTRPNQHAFCRLKDPVNADNTYCVVWQDQHCDDVPLFVRCVRNK
jgi:hypothetical protein